MNQLPCPKCELERKPRSKIVLHGVYFRSSDGKTVQRYRCAGCRKAFSQATYQACYRQKKRHKNEDVRKCFVSNVSQRRTARNLNLTRVTVARKFYFLSLRAEYLLEKMNREKAKASEIEFDDLETFEHSKCKPLSVTLAVESGTRRILGLEISAMPARGALSEKAKKYGFRRDGRRRARRKLLRKIAALVDDEALIKSDCNPHYPKDVKEIFPKARHVTFLGRKPASAGQGELKKGYFDPLFSLNHTCAMMRANVNRLIRKTWCTTKCQDRLYAHLMLYAQYHNENLKS